MALVRLAVRVDRRLVLACLGLAAAILVPVAGVLATATLEPTLDPAQGSVAISDSPKGLDLDRLPRTAWALSGRDADGRHVVAFVEGPTLVGPLQADDGGPAGRHIRVLGENLTTVSLGRNVVGPGMTLIHPSVLGVAPVEAASFPARAPEPGTPFFPARGADGFEMVGIADLRDGTAALAAVSLPLVLLVASAFARLEARSLAGVVALVSALGRPERAGQVLIGRVLLVTAIGAVLTLAGLALTIQLGFLPVGWDVLASRSLAIAVALPTGAAALAGSAVAWAATVRTRATLRSRPALGDEGRIGFLPLRGRPIITGWRLLGVFCLVGLVVALDVGLPIAASSVPAALAGDDGEWVVGAAASSLTSGRASDAPAKVMGQDPAIDAIVAEVFVPTVMRGHPVVARGADWSALAQYHGLELVRGDPPRSGELALGSRAAAQLDADVGDHLVLPGVNGILARLEVSGIYRSAGLLGDEAVLSMGDARALAELPGGTVHVLRMKPDSKPAREALERSTPLVLFQSLHAEPASAPAGSVATAYLDAVNLGGAPGSRVANLRVGNQSVATTVVRLAAYEQRLVPIPFVVPEGPYELQVNPEASGQGSDPRRELQGPAGAVVGSSAAFTLLADGAPRTGATVSLYAGLDDAGQGVGALASAVTDAEGRATLQVPRAGELAVASHDALGSAIRPFYGIAAANATRSVLVVEAAFVEPGVPVPGEPAVASARVRNAGGVAGTERVEFEADGVRLGLRDVTLGPGEARTVAVDYVPRSRSLPEANGVRAAGATSTRVDGEVVDAGPVRAGAALQQDVADRLLGNAGAVLGGLAVTTAAAALVVLVLATRRTMASRRGIVAVLATVWTPERIRRRAATEGAVLGGLAGVVGVAGAKAFILLLGAVTTVRAFGHALPDPYTPLFMLQVAAATAFLGGLAMHNSIERRVGPGASRLLRASGGEGGE